MTDPNPAPKSAAEPSAHLLAEVARELIDEQRRGRRWRIAFRAFTALWLIALLVVLGSIGRGGATSTEPHTALVRIEGIIADDADVAAETINAGLRDAFEDPQTRGVILQINSPGGSPVQSSRIHTEIRRLRSLHPDIPVHAVVADLCASGGYFIAAAADQIHVDRSSIVGSIGVILNGFGFTGSMDRLGVERRLLTAGENKGFLDPFSPLKAEEVEHARSLLDSIHAHFIDAVKTGRGERLRGGDELFSGLLWSGDQAVELGLADALGDVDSVAREVIGAESVVDFTPRPDFAERLVRRFGVSVGEALARVWGVPAGLLGGAASAGGATALPMPLR